MPRARLRDLGITVGRMPTGSRWFGFSRLIARRILPAEVPLPNSRRETTASASASVPGSPSCSASSSAAQACGFALRKSAIIRSAYASEVSSVARSRASSPASPRAWRHSRTASGKLSSW